MCAGRRVAPHEHEGPIRRHRWQGRERRAEWRQHGNGIAHNAQAHVISEELDRAHKPVHVPGTGEDRDVHWRPEHRPVRRTGDPNQRRVVRVRSRVDGRVRAAGRGNAVVDRDQRANRAQEG